MTCASNAPTRLKELGTARRLEGLSRDFKVCLLLAIVRPAITFIDELGTGQAGTWGGA